MFLSRRLRAAPDARTDVDDDHFQKNNSLKGSEADDLSTILDECKLISLDIMVRPYFILILGRNKLF